MRGSCADDGDCLANADVANERGNSFSDDGDSDGDQGGDADEDLAGNYEPISLKQSDLDPVHYDHHLKKVSIIKPTSQ